MKDKDMEEKRIRVRFAPSPTGPQHIGGIRTALYNYLVAKKAGGDFILRIEDTDSSRYVPDSEEYILESLKWAGIMPNEGIEEVNGKLRIAEVPSEKNPHAPYRQSQRKSIYKVYVKLLLDSGKAYVAFDTPEEIEKLREEAEANKKNFSYNVWTRKNLRNSLTLSEKETQELMDTRTDWVIRFKMPEVDEVIKMHDEIRGDIEVHTKTLDDKVLWKRSDELPTYHLANIVDDHLMEITDVIRGEEWLSSLPLHVMLYNAFGWQAPRFTHLSDLLKPAEMGPGKLSKRDGDKGDFPVFPISWHSKNIKVKGYRESGYLPEAFINFLAYLGWNPGDDTEIKSLDELVDEFSISRCQLAGARFNPKKNLWYSREHLRLKTPEELEEIIKPELERNGYGFTKDHIIDIINLLHDRIDTLNDIYKKGQVFFKEPDGIKLSDWDAYKEYIPDALRLLRFTKDLPEWENLKSEMENYLIGLVGNWKVGVKVINCSRMIISGSPNGPDLVATILVLGRETLINRINLFKANYGYRNS